VDSRQLPPVNEKLSLTFMVKHKYELTEIVRQKNGNPNQLLLIDARSDVEKMSNLVEELTKTEQNNTNNDDRGNRQGYIITNSQENFYNLLIELYSDSEAKTNMNFIKTLVYTNIAAKKVNKFIKDKINPSKEILSVGDVLLGYKTVMDPINDKIIVQNSKDYRIYSLEIIEKKVQLKTYKFFRVNVDFINKTYIDILHPESYNEFKDVLSRLFLNAKANRAWRPFYRYREQFIILENFYNDDNTTLTTKDIDFGYAMTIHKSQGSTYNNVAVIYNNIKVCRVVL
jgi:exodeoxyribonuclease-5